jgi:uncharacterized protein (TIGR04255 family)
VYDFYVKRANGWKQAPLIYVVAQILFDTNYEISNQLANIQSGLKKLGLTETGPITEHMILENGAMQSRSMHEFFSPTQDLQCVVGTDELRLATASYTTFETFLDLFSAIQNMFSQDVQKSRVKRIGLRYIDMLQTAPKLSLDQQIQEHVIGMQLEDQISLHKSIIQRPITNRTLIFQVLGGQAAYNHLRMQFEGKKPLIPRLIAPETAQININDVLLLDVDVNELMALTDHPQRLKDVAAMLPKFHTQASDLFKGCLTKVGLKHYRGY